MNVYIPYTRLPSEYQEVEYIESTGTQFINTGVFAYNKYQIETKIEVTGTTQDTPVFGSIDSTSGDNGLGGYYHLTPYNSKWYVGINNSETSGGTYNPTSGTQYTIVYNNTNSYLNVNGTDLFSVSGTVGYSGTNIGISRRGQGGNGRYGKFKYFYFKIYDKTAGQYIKNLVPCYRKSDNVIGMYDIIDNQFYTNSGTGTFSKGNDVNMSEVKNIYIGEYSAYQEVEYIQSSGTQYIDTGVYVNPDYKVEIKYQNVTFTSYGSLFGTRDGSNARFLLRYSTADGSIVTAQRSTAYNVYTENFDTNSYYDHNLHTLALNRYFYIDNTLLKTFSASTSTTAFPYSLYLFALNSQGSPVDYGVYKIYYCKIYDNSGTLVRDLVPCYSKSDSVIGMYDLVNDTFYTNSGTGTFTKGPDVN